MSVARVLYDEIAEDYFLEGIDNSPRIKEIAGAFGWLDIASKDASASVPWFTCAALYADDTINFRAEAKGPLYDCAQKAVAIKDNQMVGRVYVDDTESQICQYLRKEIDGLFAYKAHAKPDVLDRPRYISPPRTWPTFRGRKRLAKMVPIPEVDLINFLAGYDRLVDDIAKGSTRFHGETPGLQRVMRRKYHEVANHPALKAMVWLHNGLVRSRLHKDGRGYGAAPYYSNIGRR